MPLSADYDYCESVIQEHSASFYKAFKILPQAKRRAIFAIYAFCRLADDCVDVEKSEEGLSRLLDDLNAFHHGDTPNTPIFRALRDVFDHFQMSIEPFYHMIEGQKMDLNFKAIESLEDLDHYCYHVASTVGLMILPIIATQNAHLLGPVAVDLGIAMQYTNILRDVGEDFRNKRIYLPKALLMAYSVDLNALKKPSSDFIALWESLAIIAEQKYKRFMTHANHFDKDSQVAVKRSALFYKSILNAVRKNRYDCLNTRVRVSSLSKVILSIKALL